MCHCNNELRDIVLIYTQQRHSSDIGGASHVKYTWMSHREQRYLESRPRGVASIYGKGGLNTERGAVHLRSGGSLRSKSAP